MTRKNKPLPDGGRIKELMTYKTATGDVITDCHISCYADGYLRISIDGQTYQLSRIIWKYMTDDDPENLQVDHIDCDRGNLKWRNLRLATTSQNLQNRRRFKNNTTGYKGVTRWRGKYRAQICKDYHSITLGDFDTVEEAAISYMRAALELFGEFARLT